MVELLNNLTAHAEWANAATFRQWAMSPELLGNVELRERWEHILVVQQCFLQVLRGEPVAEPSAGPPASFDELRRWAIDSHAGERSFVAQCHADDLARTMWIPWFEPPCAITVAEALTQVAMHTQHHRGQWMTRLKQLGGRPEDVDFIVWLALEKPAAAWS